MDLLPFFAVLNLRPGVDFINWFEPLAKLLAPITQLVVRYDKENTGLGEEREGGKISQAALLQKR